jgi:hypothetical protein
MAISGLLGISDGRKVSNNFRCGTGFIELGVPFVFTGTALFPARFASAEEGRDETSTQMVGDEKSI